MTPDDPAFPAQTLNLQGGAACASTNCGFDIPAPSGTIAYRASVYGSADGSGTPLFVGTLQATVESPASPPQVVLALGGPVATVAFDRSRIAVAADGAPHSVGLRLIARTGSGGFALTTPAFFQGTGLSIGSDPNGAVVVASAGASGDPAAVGLRVDTSRPWTSASLTAQAAGLTPTQTTIVALRTSVRSLALAAGGPAASLTIAESGTAGPFIGSSSNPGIASVTPSASAVQPGGAATFVVTPGAQGGSAVVSLGDPDGVTITVSVTVASQTGGSIGVPGPPRMNAYATGIPPSATLGSITAGADGNLWFGAGNAIGTISPAGAITMTTAGITATDIAGITAGPDSNIWFAERDLGGLASITPSDSVSEYGASLGGAPAGLATGRDGALWVTLSDVDAVVRYSELSGTNGYYPVTTGAAPQAIVSGPDGNLWFTEPGANQIGRLTTRGVLTEFGSGISAGAGLAGIAAGIDGNLWFTEALGGRIGRITPAGAVTEFAAGITPGAAPTQIAAGADGNLWFSEPGTKHIGRVTTGGAVAEFAPGASGTPAGVARGPDGALWFTLNAPGSIVRVQP